MKKITLAVTGGIAAYKAADLCARLTQAGFDVTVIMTEHACEFVGPLTFETLSGHTVYTDTFTSKPEEGIHHIVLGQKTDALVIMPATANIIAKYAHGVADDMLSSTLMAATCPVIVCPAMHARMYDQAVIQENMRLLRQRGVTFVGPVEGRLATGQVGMGHIASVEDVLAAICRVTDTNH